MQLTFQPTTSADADLLVGIRIAAMRESLEQLGRFDPERARARFLNAFDPEYCHFVEINGVNVGFFVVRPFPDHLLLDHLYVLPEHQGQGIGSEVLGRIFADADARKLSIRLGALRGSKANAFYRRHGFQQVSEAEWDIYYLRERLA
ncbi:GNAT family N-acetyltransferase [Pseudomonas sp. MOIL14HWK12:I2]|uniref:GNAT family N-acetyltransferase n=1 Tax=Pseudomonas sp. MOIL14HWK12:I2 TaxID=1033994 RepID=UPI00048672DD|nr:GNAT family N-acetyltransferase [Pseudomonas sp. MOIL14HWK12:I2]